jgi:glucose/arabinose dehydrogenase
MHNSGALHFGRDGKLYVTVGDSAQAPTPKPGILPRKMLRLNADAPFRAITHSLAKRKACRDLGLWPA